MKKIEQEDSLNYRILRDLIAYFSPYIKQITVLFSLIFLNNLTSLTTPYFLKIIIDDILPSKNFTKLINTLCLLVVAYILRIGISYVFDTLYVKVTQNVISDMRSRIMEIIFNKPIRFFQEKQIGETVYILSNDVNNVQSSLSYLINDLLNNLILIGCIIAIMLSINVNLTVISLVIVPVIAIITIRLSPHIHLKFKELQKAESTLLNCFSDELRNIKLIKTFHTRDFEINKINNLQNKIVTFQVENTRINSINKNLITFIITCLPVMILAYGGNNVINNTLTTGSLIAFIQYLNRLLPPVTAIANGYSSTIRSIVSMERISSFLNENVQSAITNPVNSVLIHQVKYLNLNNITFKYELNDVILGMNAKFYLGKTYLIKGESGIGKSTIVNLICNLIYPTIGSITINEDIAYEKISNVNQLFCLIERENQIFSDTVFKNVDYGAFTNDECKVESALQQVNMLTKVQSLEKGIHTELNSNITVFSEGEKQRLSLAKVFVKPYSIIVLDEATSNIDVHNERIILKRMRVEHPEAIILIISHRYSFDDLCDSILLFQNGKLALEHSI
jgi:ABC-type bacteriocin/lantibiotic exporter with double-glycine peptidase domain